MCWFTGVLFAYFAVSVVVGSNVGFGSKNAGLSNTHITNERFPTFPRRDSPFRNETSISETGRTTSRVSESTLYMSTTVESFPTSKSQSSAPSTVIAHEKTHSYQSDTTTLYSAVEPNTSIGRSSNTPAATSIVDESRIVTEVQQPAAPSSISLVSPRQTSVFSYLSSDSLETASSIRTSPTVKELPVTSDVRTTANNPIPSTVWMNADSSRISSIQLPTTISSVIISSQISLSTSLKLPASVNDLQQNTRSSTSSLMVTATTPHQTVTRMSLSGAVFTTLSSSSQQGSLSETQTETSSVVIPSTQTSLALSRTVTSDATVITTNASVFSGFSLAKATSKSSLKLPSFIIGDSASRTHTLPLPTLPGAPTTAAALPQDSVYSFTSRSASGYQGIIHGSISAAITGMATPTSVTSYSAKLGTLVGSTSLPLNRIDTASGTSSIVLSVSAHLESLSSSALSETSTYPTISGPSLSSTLTSEVKNETSSVSATKYAQPHSSRVDSSTFAFGGSVATSASAASGDATSSRTPMRTDTIVTTMSDTANLAVSLTSMSLQATGSAAQFATENSTVSSSVALGITSLGISSPPSTIARGSSLSTVETSSVSSPISSSLMQAIISSTTRQILSTVSSTESVRTSNSLIQSSDDNTVTSATALGVITTPFASSWLRPSLSTSLVGWANISLSSATETPAPSGSATTTESISSSHASKSGSLRMFPGFGTVSSTATSAISSTSTPTSHNPTSNSPIVVLQSSNSTSKISILSPISTLVTKTRTQSSNLSSRTSSSSNNVQDATISTQSTAHTPTSSPTETVVASAPPQLTPSQTAGVALGSTAGVLLAIVAAIFVARRYHARHAAKRESWGSPGVYPKVAYLYDPPLGEDGGGSSGDDEALAFMSGGASGFPSTRSRTPPRAPQNSFDYDPRNWSGFNWLQYRDPGNPFKDPEDSFIDWRSSDALGSPSDTVSALAAAVAEYGAGPQRPLPPVPVSVTPLFRDYVIPSPTLSPVANGCSLRRSHARSSRRNSVRSQRSLRSFRACPPASPNSKDHPPTSRGPRQNILSIKEGYASEPFPDPVEHDLLLPVDVRTETPDSVMVYAPVPRTPMQPALSTILSDDQTSMTSLPSIVAAKSLAAAQPRSTGSILFPTSKDDQYSYTSFVYNNPLSPSYPDRPTSDHTITQRIYSIVPSSPPPQSTSAPRNKSWEEIKRTSNGSSSLHSPLPTPPFYNFSPPRPNVSPPPPLKKRSLIQLCRKTPLASTGQVLVPTPNAHSASSFTPLAVKTTFMFNSNKSFEGPRMSLLAKVNSMGDMRDDAASPRKRKGGGLGYRDSIS